jgi:AICAR transformylase/IMP cyclohydrolase PurH
LVNSLRPVSRALISVSDKDGIVAFATALGRKKHRTGFDLAARQKHYQKQGLAYGMCQN